jgi:signal transduction histidine kinase/HAMP domain-containing protein
MSFIFTLLTSMAFPSMPTPVGWVVWMCLLGVLVYSLYYWRTLQPAWKGSSWGILIVLLVLTPLTSLFIGLRFPNGSALPIPGVPSTLSPGSALMLFSAVPWMLAGGFLGPIGAAVVGLLSGALRGAWDSFQFFTALEYALLGVLFSVNVRQNFRTITYRVLRQPFVSALVLIPLHTLLYIIGTFLSIKADIPPAARLDFALTSSWVATLSFAGEVVIAGLVAQIMVQAFPTAWGSKQPLQPSPAEKSLEIRFLIGTGTFISLLLLTLLIGDWLVAGRAARQMLEKRLSSTAESAAQSVPFFLETGQNLAVQLASDPRLLEATDPELSSIFGQRIQIVPYFDQLFVMDVQSAGLLAGYPESERRSFALYTEERMGLMLASNGVLTQIYSIPPLQVDGLARTSFMVAILDSTGQVRRVLIGRTTLETNPLTQPLITSLQSIKDLRGTGILLDENGRIIYHYSESGQVPASIDVEPGVDARFYTDTASDGTRQLVYYQPVLGRPWAVVLTIPAQQAQQLALNIAMPLSIMIILLALFALISLRVGLRVVTGSLHTLAVEADRIAQGKLDRPLYVEGVDEVGQLRRAFEQMRVSLHSRLEESNRLLHVSQRVASSLEMQDAVQPVLEAIQSIGASSVRVVLSPSILPDTPVELPSHFASGPADDTYAHLDDQILALAQKQEQTVIPNMTRTREFVLDLNQAQPQALLAVALRHENHYYGVVWAGFDQPHAFTESDIRFVTTLAGQAALAVANARLFLNVEAARRQLEAILNSTPDPVLVTDSHDRLLLANRAANQALGTPAHKGEHSTEKVVKQRALLDLLQSSTREKQSAEIVLPDGRTYFATASSVVVEGHSIGRVCILRDITHFKELDIMKSDFVATVSHDLRSPLTLMRGYATMLMVGEMNEQQQGYVKKIIIGVENMSRLVNNLLDLGRIEVGVGLQVEDVPVLDILERVTSTLQLQAAQKNISLNVELPKDMPNVIQADQALLHQAVYNLVENALKYTPDNGSVTITASTMDNSLIFSVADTGIGILPDDLPRLFEKFYRGSQREARAQHGTGLGLAIVHSIAERHGGKVWVDSKLGKGSIFHLQIPLVQYKESLIS